MKTTDIFRAVPVLPILLAVPLVLTADFTRPVAPFAPAAGEAGSTAVAHDDENIATWADGYEAYQPGTDVDSSWKEPREALGPAGTDSGKVVVLGRGGEITLTFPHPVTDGPGFDFALFENGFSDSFLELAYVEVSSDGLHFVRFPAYSLTPGPVTSFGTIDPGLITGLASKYRLGYGTPFDLSLLREAHAAAMEKEEWKGPAEPEFSQQYRDDFVANFPHIDLQHITHIRIVDIPGDGSARDAEGFSIYDPYPTSITAGFDLDGVAAMNVRDNRAPTEAPILATNLGETPSGDPELRLIVRVQPALGESLVLQASPDLQTWEPVQPPVREEIVTGTGAEERREITYGIRMEEGTKFLRVLYSP